MSQQQGAFDLDNLRGRVAVITGAGNNGIGWGIAAHAATQLGMHVAILDLHEHLVQAAAQRLQAMAPGVRVLGVACDVTDPAALAAARDAIVSAVPDSEIGAVFANAGVIFNRTVLRSTVDEWMTTLNVNVMGVVNTIQAFVPLLREQGSPAILCHTASVGGLVRGDGGGAAYQASKHAVVALSESLSFELAARAPWIRVHVLCPCIVATGLGVTSQDNARVQRGEVDPSGLQAFAATGGGLAMTPENHARQVFDLIAAGDFYLITDNVRPYVDHDFPFDAIGMIRERTKNLLARQLDNSDAWPETPGSRRSAILKGPLFEEMARRRAVSTADGGVDS